MSPKKTPFRTIWLDEKDENIVWIIDQRHLPHQLIHQALTTVEEAAAAIQQMHVRGAPLIGATAAWGLYLAVLHAPQENFKAYLNKSFALLSKTRPTAVDLFHALTASRKMILASTPEHRINTAKEAAIHFCTQSAAQCEAIGRHGLELIKAIAKKKAPSDPIHILTHCNAGKLACVDFGTATAPIYLAHQQGIPVHVWVDETRPRNQGARLTAYELEQAKIPHTVIVDNVGGHLMQHGQVDMVIVGTDRTTRQGDVANKIGTYLKALAADDNGVPFYVALPTSTIDWRINDGLREIPIEERGEEEVAFARGWDGTAASSVRIPPKQSPCINYGFDVTPARLVTGLITERGVCAASKKGLSGLFPEQA